MPQWSVDSETSFLRDVLLCRPDFYHWIPTNDISLKSLASGKQPQKRDLERQYGELVDSLESAGVRCHFLKPEAHLPYQVYTRDSSQITPWGPVITQLSRPERRGEIAAVVAFYEQSGCGIWRFASSSALEGGDIHIIRPGLLAVGATDERTTSEAADAFASWFTAAGWTTRVISFPKHFLHLDVIFSMVTDGLAIGVTDVLDDAELEWFSDNGIRILPVTYKEAMGGMACNVLALGDDRVISPRHSKRVNEMLRSEGLMVLDPEIDLFARGGGSVHCMTMPLRRDPLRGNGTGVVSGDRMT